jgi:hypothetical protein
MDDGQLVAERHDFQVQRGARLDDKSQRWSSEMTTDDTTAGYRRMPGSSIDATRTKFSVGTSRPSSFARAPRIFPTA